MSSELRGYVKAAIAEHPDAGVQELAIYASNAIPVKQLRIFMAESLVDLVRQLVGDSRRKSMDNALGDGPTISPKMRDRASWWAQMLTERVNVDGEWKALGDCTADDLTSVIDEREKLMNRISGQIENFKQLRKLMAEHDAEYVSNIPPQKSWDK